MSEVYRIDLDIAGEDGHFFRTREWARGFQCIAELLTESGPAGGNPMYRFVGSKDNLEKLVREYAGGSISSPDPKKVQECVEDYMKEFFEPELVSSSS